jgi:hypothetical protein
MWVMFVESRRGIVSSEPSAAREGGQNIGAVVLPKSIAIAEHGGIRISRKHQTRHD